MRSAAPTVPSMLCAPALTAKLAPWMEQFASQPELARKCLNEGGSPVHIVVASEFKRNVRDLCSPLLERGVAGGIYFARKANKLPWFVTAAKEAGIGVDTASPQELRETLALGVNPKTIISTAIGKTRALIAEAAKHDCLVVLDNMDELDIARAVSVEFNQTIRIALRFSGFELNGRKLFSRFGLPAEDAHKIISDIEPNGLLSLELLHAHLDRYDIEERACAARNLIELVDFANAAGHRITSIDLGGGILMRYLQREDQWLHFLSELRRAVAGQRDPFTYQDDGFGLIKMGEAILGTPELYPAWNNLSKERFISAILDNTAGGTTLHKEISSRGLNLYFEPGRALLDNTGITLSQVTFRKRDSRGYLLIGTGMNRTNLRPFRAEFCSDPILITAEKREKLEEGAYIVGNLCSESDLIFRRKLDLGIMPLPEDVMMFANSAGYLAHHMEIGTHGSGLPLNLLIDPNSWDIVASA